MSFVFVGCSSRSNPRYLRESELMLAVVENKDANVVVEILKRDADAIRRDEAVASALKTGGALYTSAYMGNTGVVEVLLRYGASADLAKAMLTANFGEQSSNAVATIDEVIKTLVPGAEK